MNDTQIAWTRALKLLHEEWRNILFGTTAGVILATFSPYFLKFWNRGLAGPCSICLIRVWVRPASLLHLHSWQWWQSSSGLALDREMGRIMVEEVSWASFCCQR